jgi:hypothetical protein
MNFIDVESVNNHTCAISEDNDLYCFGKGYTGIERVSQTNKFRKLDVSLNFMCALSLSGELYCRGSNSFGELGNGTVVASELFQLVDFSFNQADINFNEGVTYSINSQIDSLTFDNATQTYPEKDFLLTIKNDGADNATSIAITIDPAVLPHLEFTGGGASPGVGGTCLTTLASDDDCVIALTFKPTAPFPSGLNMNLTVTYQDSLSTKTSNINLRGYSIRTLAELDFLYNGSSITSSIDYNTTFTPLDASSAESLTRVISIQNNSTDDMELLLASISGVDSAHYQYTANQFPGTNGTCSTILAHGLSCTIEIQYKPLLESTTLPDNSHQANLTLQIRKGLTITSTDLPLKGFAVMDTPNLAFYDGATPLAPAIELNDLTTQILAITAETIERTIQLKNQSNTNATVLSYTVSGADQSQYTVTNTCLVTMVLVPLQTCSITVLYNPILPSPITGHDIAISVEYTNTFVPLDVTRSSSISIKSFSL